ncbi:MAG: 2-hydroxy-3-oxopropionate reductase [Halobacteria archaeon]|nr:2-hydroxy-3-oxopropionate reductase [Halobacteria archaeon]
MTDDKTVGFIGLGIMGKPMAENLLEAGYSVVGNNRSPEPVEDLVSQGADSAATPEEVAERSDVVISVLPDSDVVKDVALGDDGVIDGISEGDVFIDMSTISPTVTQEIADELHEVGADMLDAPISGGEEGAIEGTLSIMVGGNDDTLDDHRDLFEVMGDTVTHCGDHGSGQVAKACNQIVLGVTLQGVSEALVFAKKAGADLDAVLNAISGGAASCWALDARAPRVIEGNFDPGFFASYHYKDLRIATDAGEAFGSPMPATELVHEMFKSMEQKGLGMEDHSAIIKIVEDLADEKARVE